MSAKVTVRLDQLPAAITASARAVLEAHGLSLVRSVGLNTSSLDGAELERVLRELGRNAAQAVYCLDDSVSDPEPEDGFRIVRRAGEPSRMARRGRR